MELEPKTIAEHIECLARLTGAPESFVDQVRDLFSSKGIPLESDATPYIGALDEAFTREETIRANTNRATANVSRLKSNFKRIGEAYLEQRRQLRRVRTKPLASASDGDEPANTVIVDGDHRSFVMPMQTDRRPMVPGPEDPQ